jgi:hypothetical protein
VEDIPTQGLRREALQPCRRWMAGTPRQASLDQEVMQVRTNLLWVQAIRGALGELGSTGYSGDVGRLGLWGQPLPLQVADHLGT